jgi:hypothetical protein
MDSLIGWSMEKIDDTAERNTTSHHGNLQYIKSNNSVYRQRAA